MNHLFTRIPQLEQKFVSFCNFSPQLVQYNELLLEFVVLILLESLFGLFLIALLLTELKIALWKNMKLITNNTIHNINNIISKELSVQ